MSEHAQYQEPAMLPVSTLILSYLNKDGKNSVAEIAKNITLSRILLAAHPPGNDLYRYIQKMPKFVACLEFMCECELCIQAEVRPSPVEWGLPTGVYHYLLNMVHHIRRYHAIAMAPVPPNNSVV